MKKIEKWKCTNHGTLKNFYGSNAEWILQILPTIKKYGCVFKFSFFCFQDNCHWWVWVMQQQLPGKLDTKKLWAYGIFTLKQVDKKGNSGFGAQNYTVQSSVSLLSRGTGHRKEWYKCNE